MYKEKKSRPSTMYMRNAYYEYMRRRVLFNGDEIEGDDGIIGEFYL